MENNFEEYETDFEEQNQDEQNEDEQSESGDEQSEDEQSESGDECSESDEQSESGGDEQSESEDEQSESEDEQSESGGDEQSESEDEQNESGDCDDQISELIRIDKNTLCIGDVQGGKTKYISIYCLECIKKGFGVVVIVDNYRDDKTRTESRIYNYLKLNGFSNSMTDIEDFKPGCVTVVLNMKKSLARIYDKLTTIKHNCVRIVIDEADIISNIDISNRSKIIKKMLETIICSYVTATPKSIEETFDLANGDVIRLPTNPDYLGFGDFNKVELEALNLKAETKNFDKILEVVKRVYKKCSSHIFIKNEKEYKVKGLFVNAVRRIDDQRDLGKKIAEEYKNSCVIVYCGDYLSIIRDGVEKKSNQSLNDELYTIQKSWRKTDCKLFIIAHDKMARGKSLRPEMPSLPKDCTEMMLITNFLYMNLADTEYGKIQAGLRLCGIYPGTKPKLNFFSDVKTLVEIEKILLENTVQIDHYMDHPEEITKESAIPTTRRKKSYPAQYYKIRSDKKVYYPNAESLANGEKYGLLPVVIHGLKLLNMDWRESNDVMGHFIRLLDERKFEEISKQDLVEMATRAYKNSGCTEKVDSETVHKCMNIVTETNNGYKVKPDAISDLIKMDIDRI
jgi:hypothetical protein